MMALALRFTPYIAAIALVAFSHFMAYRHGVSTERITWEARTASAELQAESQRAELERKARTAEQASAEALANIDSAYQQGRADAQADTARTIADLHSGAIGLRERFTCPNTAQASGLPKASTSTGQRDAASAGGLRAEDARFLVQLADQADQVAQQLKACQAIVTRDRVM